jgi:UDP-N-acetyl-D-glucosamine dehydrogenase
MEELIEKINNGSAVVGLVGLGYVGLPLAIAFAQKFRVYGYDVDSSTIARLRKGMSHIQDVPDKKVAECTGRTFFSTNLPADLAKCDFIIICVPTPLTDDHIPDLSSIKSACITIAGILRKNQFVILESTTYPGTTEEVVVPILEESGLCAGEDFGVAYSPERIDPGNKHFTVEQIPKVVGGIDEICTETAAALYGSVIGKIVRVRDTKTAESVKMVENIFRNVNIALVNELALIFERMGIDTWEVIDAAATKPYGYMPFYPGPGIGGHCIPLDPFYMSYKAKKYGLIPRFIETSGEINEFMKVHTVNLAEKGLKQVGKRIYGANITVMGLAYKRNINDSRESPAVEIIEELVRVGANVRVYDPFVPSIKTRIGVFTSAEDRDTALAGADCALFLVDHDVFRNIPPVDFSRIMASPVIVDGKNLFTDGDGMVYMGIGKGDHPLQ